MPDSITRFNANNRLALRYNVEDARDTGELVGQTQDGGGIGTPSGGRDLFIRDQSLVGTLDSVLKPNLVNTVLVQYARRHYNFPGTTGEPDLSVVNDLEFGHNFGTYDAIYESRVKGPIRSRGSKANTSRSSDSTETILELQQLSRLYARSGFCFRISAACTRSPTL